MAETPGPPAAERLKHLLRHAARFSFYQAVRWVQALHPGAVPVGHEGPVHGERLRLRPSVSLSFPPADLESAELSGEPARVRLTTTFLGLYGADSPLPYAYSEHLAQIAAEPSGERVRAFYDILHHRLLSLLFRAWSKYRPASTGPAEREALLGRVLSFAGYSAGLGLGGEQRPRLAELRLLALRHRSVDGLRFLLCRRLGYAVGVRQMASRRVGIPTDQRTRLGQQGCTLGRSVVLGERLWDRNKLQLQVAAEDFEQFLRLLPGAADNRAIGEVMGTYPRSPQAYEVQVCLQQEQVPPWELGSGRLPLGMGPGLGQPPRGAVVRWDG